MHDKMDLHTHTIASGHAYSTLTEMIRAAADQGLELYGCSDHGPAMNGTLGADYFINFKVIPRELFGVKIVMGAELNILDPSGSVDLSGKHSGKAGLCDCQYPPHLLYRKDNHGGEYRRLSRRH